MKRRTLSTGLAAMIALPALSLGSAPARAQGVAKLRVKLDFSPWGMHGAMHLALQKGLFKAQGLDVEVQDGTGTISTLQLLSAGQADIGQVALGTMAVAKENGLDLISVAGFARTGDLAVLMDQSQGIQKPKDLAGKKIVCFTTSPWAPFIEPFLKANGMTKSSIELVMVAPSAMISTYASGNSDGFMSQAPFGQPMVLKTRKASALLLGDSGISFPSYGLALTPKTLESKREAIGKFVQVQVKAWQYIYDGHVDEAVAAIVAQRPNAKLDPDVLKGQIVAYRAFFESPSSKNLAFGLQTDADWAAAIKSMEQTSQIKPGHKPSDYYTNALLSV
ncbi:ABC transporter substrate-binding protein [Variovorax sp. PBL-E5]|uniref:ABC transporter substrate-binding protein n=1 Tax=Variovorax sp. PBL-E5 TaxID=434014 RepID=UPI0013180A97|nr:ABC transporter substrate-binding protein [Variovorax sp. PBL-E5]VTU37746.1 Putative aliphatic sulfonates-binding protein precursor [Variovorax sp. PBL-E5]